MTKMKASLVFGLALMWMSTSAGAVSWYETEPMIWKKVRAVAGEDPWQTCWRYFRNDTTRVRLGPPGTVYCYVPYHYIYGPGQSRQNFNQ
jgi:hypothetical protein